MANHRATKSGLGRDTQMKILAKYDPELAHECLEWLQDMINSSPVCGDEQPLDFDTSGSMKNFAAVLKDGTVLARMANVLQPGSIPRKKYEKTPRLAFKQMELIELFIGSVKAFGVPDEERFQTVDLYEEQSLYQVLICLQTLARKAATRGLKGFGPKEADACPRNFTEEQLRSGASVIGLQMGTNKGASQKGMTFGKTRMIID